MNSPRRTVAILLLTLVFARTLRADDFQAVSLSVEPAHIELPPGVEDAAVKFRFTNSSKEPYEVVERSAFWHSLMMQMRTGFLSCDREMVRAVDVRFGRGR